MQASLSSLGVHNILSVVFHDINDIPLPLDFTARLLLRAGIQDGSSNTIMFATSTGPVRAVSADASRIAADPNVLKNGFGLLMPAGTGLPFHTGSALKTCSLLPHLEQDNVHRQRITLEWVRVASVARVGADVAVWLQPAGIIAVLIG